MSSYASRWLRAMGGLVLLTMAVAPSSSPAVEPAEVTELAEALGQLRSDVVPENRREELASMIGEEFRLRAREVNSRSRAAWNNIRSLNDWEEFRDVRLARLRASLGRFPSPPERLGTRVTGTVTGDGYRIENILYESRPGFWVTGNVYRPSSSLPSMPGILLVHSHHRPKTQGELQDMGMTWARRGATVLVIDQVGHGERAEHGFHGPGDWRGEYQWWRQDYYFRYDSGVQLHLVGDSLMGWMVWDLMRGVDLLLGRPGIDPKRIVILGAVAGGGDPAAVTAALDRRITGAVPFNFGGPQPETRYPLPEDAETSFNYLGGASWESTRNLKRSGVDGFLHWVIVGGIAPRSLIYGHEFSWDRERDPVWKRLERIFSLYGARDRLAFAHGRGLLRGRPPESSHCTNIGRLHRSMIHPAFERWFGIAVNADDEYSARREVEELRSMTIAAKRELNPRSLVDLLSELGEERSSAARRRLREKPFTERRASLRSEWSRVLGNVAPRQDPIVVSAETDDSSGGAPLASIVVERIVLEVEPGIIVPLILLSSRDSGGAPRAVVIALAQSGKSGFLRHRSGEIAALVAGGAAVCLPDVRGAGPSRGGFGDSRGQSFHALLFGETLLGARLRDLRSVIAYLRTREPRGRLALWGDSFAAVNPPETVFKVPRRVAGRPKLSEPAGALLALLGALYEDDIRCIYVKGGLSGYRSVLESPYVCVPHDVVVPGVLTTGDLCDVAGALAPRPLRIEGLVDGLNRLLSDKAVREVYQPALASYREAEAEAMIAISPGVTSPASWFLSRL